MIYRYIGEDDGFLAERFEVFPAGPVEYYVWQRKDRRLGFTADAQGIEFIKALIKDAFTVLFLRNSKSEFEGKVQQIKKTDEVDNHKGQFRGITLLDSSFDFSKLYEDYQAYLKAQKKNELFIRYGKEPKELWVPDLLTWFHKKEYTMQFNQFVENNDLQYLVWDISEDGTYFFQPGNTLSIYKQVEVLTQEMGLNIVSVRDHLNMPFH